MLYSSEYKIEFVFFLFNCIVTISYQKAIEQTIKILTSNYKICLIFIYKILMHTREIWCLNHFGLVLIAVRRIFSVCLLITKCVKISFTKCHAIIIIHFLIDFPFTALHNLLSAIKMCWFFFPLVSLKMWRDATTFIS